jgi:acyl carrier protein
MLVVQSDMHRRLRDLISAVLGIEADQISSDDSPSSVPQWDSVAHLQLMLAIEDEFGIRFEADELASLKSVAMIEARLNRAGGA